MQSQNKGYMSRLFKKILYIYAAILFLMSIWASYSSYEKNRNEFYNEIDSILLVLNKEYENNTKNFWRLYTRATGRCAGGAHHPAALSGS